MISKIKNKINDFLYEIKLCAQMEWPSQILRRCMKEYDEAWDMMRRYEISEDNMNDCITVTDNEEKLKTSFDSDIILSPLEDASTVIDELNVQTAINKMLIEHLEHYEDIEDIKYWIEEVREDLE